MKKFFLVVAVVLVAAVAANAQDKKWNVGIGGGVAIPTGDASDYVKTGFDGFVNGMYSITPNFSIGGEINYTSLPGKSIGDFGINIGGISVGVNSDAKYNDAGVTAFLAKGIYAFGNAGWRPYLGAGLGFYSHKDADTKFGGVLEGGVKYNHIGLGAAYHMAGKEEDVSFSYVQINFTYNFNF